MVGGSALAAANVAEVRYKNLNIEQTNDQLEAMSGVVFGTTGVSVFIGLVSLVGRVFYANKFQMIHHNIMIVLVWTIVQCSK